LYFVVAIMFMVN